MSPQKETLPPLPRRAPQIETLPPLRRGPKLFDPQLIEVQFFLHRTPTPMRSKKFPSPIFNQRLYKVQFYKHIFKLYNNRSTILYKLFDHQVEVPGMSFYI